MSLLSVASWCRVEQALVDALLQVQGVLHLAWSPALPLLRSQAFLMLRKQIRPPRWICRNIGLSAVCCARGSGAGRSWRKCPPSPRHHGRGRKPRPGTGRRRCRTRAAWLLCGLTLAGRWSGPAPEGDVGSMAGPPSRGMPTGMRASAGRESAGVGVEREAPAASPGSSGVDDVGGWSGLRAKMAVAGGWGAVSGMDR